MKPQNGTTDSDHPEPIGELLKRFTFTPVTPERDAQVAAEREADKRHRLESEVQMRLLSLTTDLGPRYSPARATLDTYTISHDAQKAAVKQVRAIAGKLETMIAEASNLILFGWIGTGKDHLAAALLYTAARFAPCRWVNGRDVFAESRDRIKQEKVERELINKLTEPTILCIADPIPIEGSQSAWNIDLLYRVIDQRYRLLRPTWMTLNVQNAKDAAERLTPPVWDRLRDNAEMVPCFWPSHRREKQ